MGIGVLGLGLGLGIRFLGLGLEVSCYNFRRLEVLRPDENSLFYGFGRTIFMSSCQNSYSQKRPHLRGYRCWVSPIGKQHLLRGIGVGLPLIIGRQGLREIMNHGRSKTSSFFGRLTVVAHIYI